MWSLRIVIGQALFPGLRPMHGVQPANLSELLAWLQFWELEIQNLASLIWLPRSDAPQLAEFFLAKMHQSTAGLPCQLCSQASQINNCMGSRLMQQGPR